MPSLIQDASELKQKFEETLQSFGKCHRIYTTKEKLCNSQIMVLGKICILNNKISYTLVNKFSETARANNVFKQYMLFSLDMLINKIKNVSYKYGHCKKILSHHISIKCSMFVPSMTKNIMSSKYLTKKMIIHGTRG